MADEQGPTFNFGFDGDEGQARTESERMAKVVESAFTAAFAKIGPQLARQLSKGFKGSTQKGLFSDLQQESATFAAAAARHTKQLREDFEALNARVQATRDTLAKTGANPRLFAVFDQAIQTAQSNLREFNRELEQGTATPARFKQLEVGLREVNKTAQREVAGIQSILKTLTVAEGKAAEAVRVERQQAATRALRESQQAHGKFVTQAQIEGAQTLAAQRTAGQRLIQQERQTQRTRIEVMRFALQQIRLLERGIGATFAGTARLASSAVGTVSSVTSRLGGILRRNNRDMNDGLRPALLAREQSLSRSFGRQSNTVRSELREQSVALQRFEAQAQTGVIGALAGRSRVGTALGLGAGIGGGFALFQGLKTGLQVGGDFVQGLAVLQAQLQLTDEQMAGVRAQSIALGNDIALPGVSALDAAQAIQILSKQFASLGAEALPNAQAAAEGVLQLARASGASAEEAGRIVGAAVNVFGVSADKAVQVADQVTNALKNAAGVGFSEFADAFQQSAAVFAQFQVPAVGAEEALVGLNTALGVLARSGNVGSDAGTSLKQFFLSTVRGSAPAKKALNEIVERAGVLGSVFFDAEGAARPLTKSLDILRAGLKGMSDQQRNTALNTIFGSDAIRTANALINVSSAEYARLTEANRAQGSAAAIAAAQNTGLRGALDALRSVIETQQIKTYEKFQGVLGRVVLRFADLLTAFFEGRGIFGPIRAGLAGIAVALGSLLVAKTVIESIKFLTIALSGLMSPIGLLVGGLAAIGGAVGVLAATSPEFRTELNKIGDSLGERLASGAEFVADTLARLVRFLRTRVFPTLVEFGTGLARRVIPFVDDTIDRIGDLSSAVVDRLAPAFAGLRSGLAGEGVTSTGLVGFAERVGVSLRQAAIGVEAFTAALQGRDFTSVLTSAGVLNEERQTAFVKFFETLGSSLRTTATRIADISSNIVNSVAEAFREGISPTQIAATLGLATLGTLIGGPLGAALGAAVGFAVSSFNFVGMGRRLADRALPQLQLFAGFVADSLPRTAARLAGPVQSFLLGPFQQAVGRLGFFLGNLLTDPRLVAAIEKLIGLAVLTGANFAKGFITGATSNLPALMDHFADVIDDVFWAALQSAFSDPLRFAKIVAGALIATSVIRAFTTAGEQGAKGVVAGFGRGIRSNVATSPTFLSAFFGGRDVVNRQAAEFGNRLQTAMQSEFARVNRDLGRLGSVAVIPRNDIGGGFVTEQDVTLARERLNRIKGNIGEVGSAGLIARQRLREGFRGISDDFADLSAQMGSKGRAIGSVIGTGILAGVGATLSGQQLGSATSGTGKALGLAGILGAALIPLITLPTTIGAPLAIATLGIGLLTAAFQDNGEAAEQARQRVRGYIDIIEQFSTAAAAAPTVAGQIADILLDQGPAVQRLLEQSGLNILSFTQDAVDGQASVAGTIRGLTSGLKVDQRRVEDFLAAEQRLGSTGKEAIDELDKAFRGRTSTTQAQALAQEISNAGVEGEAVIKVLRTLFDEGGAVQTALDKVELKPQLLIDVEAVRDSARRLGDQIGITGVQAANSQLVQYMEQLNAAGVANLEEVQRKFGLVGDAIDSLNQKRTDSLQSQIGEVTGELQRARDAAQQAIDNVIALVSGDMFGTLQQQFDRLLLSIPSVGEALAQAVTGDAEAGVAGIPIDKLFDFSSVSGAQLRQALAPFTTELQGVVRDAILGGARTPEALAGVLAPIRTEVEALNVPDDVKQAMLAQIDGFLGSQTLAAGLNQVVITSEAVNGLQNQFDDLQMKLQVDVEFSPAQILGQLRQLQAQGLITGTLPTIAEITAAQIAARATPVAGTTADRSETIIENGVTIGEMNIVAPTPIAAGSEVTRALRAAAGGGSFALAGAKS